MGRELKKFLDKSVNVAFDLEHRKKINFNISKYNAAVEKGGLRYYDIELARLRAAKKKREILSNLPEFLLEFEKNAIENGSNVLWAKDNIEAINYVINILRDNKCKLVVKSKSMTTEEIDFNKWVESNGVESIETDLGEYIVQKADEKPYHIVTPAMHKSKEDIANLFNKEFGTPIDSTPEYLTNFVREEIRNKFRDAEVGVTGANFLIADKGAAAITENEGNAIMSTAFPRVHIIIAGLERLIPSFKDLGLFWPLLSAHGTGQQITVYNSVFFGSKQDNESDGPENVYIILLDNGRSELYKKPVQAESLSCIRCGACLNACPIYKNVGGYTYKSTYSGPIGSIITPHFKKLQDYKHLSFACSLCGKCEEVCPVKIPLPKLLLYNRKDAVELVKPSFYDKSSTQLLSFVMSKRGIMDLFNGTIKNFGKSLIEKRLLGEKRSLSSISKKSFNEQWKNQRM